MQRRRVASAFDRDGLSRTSLINAACGLIGIARHLPLTGGDSGRGLIGSARRRLLPGGDTVGGLIGAARHLLSTCDKPVEALPQVAQNRVELIGAGDG